MESIILRLPWPPSANSYKTIGRLVKTKSGKYYQQRRNSKETLAFYYLAYTQAKAQMPREALTFSADATIRVELTACLSPPLKTAVKRWDLDNRAKVLIDGLMHAKILKDDSQIHKLTLEKMEPCEQGLVVVEIKAMDG